MNTFSDILYKNKKTIFIFLSIFFLIELLRTAWISDDIKITLRTVSNFIHGYGPRFNIDERVQAYTHPLWFLMISAVTFITRNIFFTAYFMPIVVSLFAFWLFLTKISKNLPNVIIAACALMLSKAFIDFSTSGLENPLSHILLILSIIFATKLSKNTSQRYLIYFFLNCSFLYLSRPDLLLLIFPLIIYLIIKNRTSSILVSKCILIGAIPALAWSLFSLYYYGFPFPNTAYAKLGASIPIGERIEQGSIYLFDSIGRDPITLALIGFGIFLGFYLSLFDACISIGILIYLIYIIFIGGDFMVGRFLTEMYMLSAILLTRSKLNNIQYILVTISIVILGMMSLQSTLLSDNNYTKGVIQENGLTDERAFYFAKFGLANLSRNAFIPPETNKYFIQDVPVICGLLGQYSLGDSFTKHYVDPCALTDPLLSHLPAKFDTRWRIGHFERNIPEKYLESIKNNKNLLLDPELHAYYDVIREITRGELNDLDRIKKIVLINIGLIKPFVSNEKINENKNS